MIAACPSSYAGAADPLIIHGACDQSVLIMFDGSGSWGTGVEAASWFRDWLAANADTRSRHAITASLRTAIDQLPASIAEHEFHWSFSIVAAILNGHTIELGACGGFAGVVRTQSTSQPLFTPARLIDQLVAQGHVTESDAEGHQYANVLCGPFFGIDDQDDLIWIEPQLIPKDAQVLIGGDGLIRYLATIDHEPFTDPESLHDALQQFSGRSAPTAIIAAQSSG